MSAARLLLLLCLARSTGVAEADLAVSPSAIALQSSKTGAVLRELTLTSNYSTPVNVSVRISLSYGSGARRRLEPAVEGSSAGVLRTADAVPVPVEDAEGPAPARATAAAVPEPCKILLKLRKGSGHAQEESSAALRRRLREDDRLPVKSWRHLSKVDIDVIDLDCDLAKDVNASLQYVREQYGDGVEFVERDRVVYPTETVGVPDDPRWSSQWGMRRIGVQKAWDSLVTKGPAWRTVTVAVIDTGVMLGHEDLKENLWTNPGEIPGNGVDDDGNGFVDDVHGYDFVDNDGDPEDVGGHGTHCAGVIAAAADNGKGVAGVAGRHVRVQVMALRFLGSNGGGLTSDAIRALDYALAMGVPISSNSWGGPDDGSSFSLRAAMRAAGDAGHLFVAAAGNDGVDVDSTLYTPCGYSGDFALCVASTTSSDTLSSFSNYGPGNVHIAAPGSSILSTYTGGGYNYLSGTSMACPHVAGAAALLWGSKSSSTLQELRGLILSTAERTSWLTGKVETGLLDVEKLVSSVESAVWLSLGAGRNSTLDLQLEPYGTAAVPLNLGFDRAPVGAYSADVVLEWPDGSSTVPVSYWLQGFAQLETAWGKDLTLDFGTVPVDLTKSMNVSLRNAGNGTARLQFGELQAPFALASGISEVPANMEARLFFACMPVTEGSWEMNVTVATNNMMVEPAPTVKYVDTYNITLRCSSSKPPILETDKFSGVSFLAGDPAGHRLLEPSVHAEWEYLLPSGSATALVAPVQEANLEGCNAHAGRFDNRILLVSRGSCYFQTKAINALAAGATGLIIYDNVAPTTLEMLAAVPGLETPNMPTFLVSNAEGLALWRRVKSGEDVSVAMMWNALTMWSGHPVHSDSDTLVLSNPGQLAYTWSTSAKLSFGQSQTQFYTLTLPVASDFSWTTVAAADELAFFKGRVVDDEATVVKLPFPFPFYGTHYEEVFVSSNGALVFDPMYVPSADAYSSLPSTTSPNGLVAPFWDDLVHASFSRLYMVHVPVGGAVTEAYVTFQFCNFTFWTQGAGNDFSNAPRVSFEARLFPSGKVDVHFKSYPARRTNTKFGVETVDGAYGVNFVSSLPFSTNLPFLARLQPWLVPETGSAGSVDLGASAQLRFRGQGPFERRGWLTVSAKDASGAWTSQRKVRLSLRVFYASWIVGDWSSCEGATVRRRDVTCRGSDGADYTHDVCVERKVCRDVPNWQDSRGYGCATYTSLASLGVCTSLYEADGYSANTACCACGGGLLGAPAMNESCPTWTSTTGTATTTTQTRTTTTRTQTTATVTATTVTATATGTTTSVTATATTTTVTATATSVTATATSVTATATSVTATVTSATSTATRTSLTTTETATSATLTATATSVTSTATGTRTASLTLTDTTRGDAPSAKTTAVAAAATTTMADVAAATSSDAAAATLGAAAAGGGPSLGVSWTSEPPLGSTATSSSSVALGADAPTTAPVTSTAAAYGLEASATTASPTAPEVQASRPSTETTSQTATWTSVTATRTATTLTSTITTSRTSTTVTATTTRTTTRPPTSTVTATTTLLGASTTPAVPVTSTAPPTAAPAPPSTAAAAAGEIAASTAAPAGTTLAPPAIVVRDTTTAPAAAAPAMTESLGSHGGTDAAAGPTSTPRPPVAAVSTALPATRLTSSTSPPLPAGATATRAAVRTEPPSTTLARTTTVTVPRSSSSSKASGLGAVTTTPPPAAAVRADEAAAARPKTSVSGSLAMTVQNAEQFVADPAVAAALQASIASVASVPPERVSVSLSLSRRLATGGRFLQSGQSVAVDYSIEVVEDSPSQEAAGGGSASAATSSIVTALGEVEPSSMTDVVVQKMTEAGNAATYAPEVTSIPQPSVRTETRTTTSRTLTTVSSTTTPQMPVTTPPPRTVLVSVASTSTSWPLLDATRTITTTMGEATTSAAMETDGAAAALSSLRLPALVLAFACGLL